MPPILLHYSLILDLAGHSDLSGTINDFLEQANLTKIEKTVETVGCQCSIRFIIEGPETLVQLREIAKAMPRGLFSEATKAAVKSLKERPNELYLELTARPPLFGFEGND